MNQAPDNYAAAMAALHGTGLGAMCLEGGTVVVSVPPARYQLLALMRNPEPYEHDGEQHERKKRGFRTVSYGVHSLDCFPVSPLGRASNFNESLASEYASHSFQHDARPLGTMWLDQILESLRSGPSELAVLYLGGRLPRRVFMNAIEHGAAQRLRLEMHWDTRLAIHGIGALLCDDVPLVAIIVRDRLSDETLAVCR